MQIHNGGDAPQNPLSNKPSEWNIQRISANTDLDGNFPITGRVDHNRIRGINDEFLSLRTLRPVIGDEPGECMRIEQKLHDM